MNALLAPALTFVLANAPAPAPDPDTVTPGPVGFLAIFLVGLAVVLLGFDMVRRIRRTTYRAQIKERLDAELAERNRGETGPEEDTKPK